LKYPAMKPTVTTWQYIHQSSYPCSTLHIEYYSLVPVTQIKGHVCLELLIVEY
jgi:hypothetical protein